MTAALGAAKSVGKAQAGKIAEKKAVSAKVPAKAPTSTTIEKSKSVEKSKITDTKKSGRSLSQSALPKLKSGKRQWMPRIPPAKSTVRYRQVIAAEVVIGLILIITEPGVEHKHKQADKAVEQLAAFIFTFFILAVMTSGGPSMARVSATLGGLIVLTLLVMQQDTLMTRVKGSGSAPPGYYNDGSNVPIQPGTPSITWPNGEPIPGQPYGAPPAGIPE